MTPQEYENQFSESEANRKAELLKINKAHDTILLKLATEYANDNNPIIVGDVVASLTQKIIVEKIVVEWSFGTLKPHMSYHGKSLIFMEKDVSNDDKYSYIYQTSVTEINGKPYKYKQNKS